MIGEGLAPDECIACGKPRPEDPREEYGQWHYFAGSVPAGAMACSLACVDVALERHQRTGRVDGKV